MAKLVVLGAGMIGNAMALDLANDHDITAIDIDKRALSRLSKQNEKIKTTVADLKETEDLTELLAPYDLVICAVPGFMGFETLKKILQAKKNVVDISFFPENCFDLDYLAKKNDVWAITDCGVAPGMSNVILGYLDSKMEVKDYECLVGGLPSKREWPFNYKAPFSPIDVIEEYTRPARYVENGEVVIREALSDCELMDIQRVGTLEAFNTDGLRTLIYTMDHIPNMKEKTLRYPGHAEYVQVLQKSGFFSETEMEVDGIAFRPIDVTARILRDNWRLKNSDEEFTVMRISIEGDENGKSRRYIYRLLDKGCENTKTTSMARTTGYTATAIANYLLQHKPESGVFAPETLGVQKEAYQYILKYLKDRNVDYRIEEFTLN
ncbi:saccharopine dehydrogenase family protein [Aliikangiella coralliicola]|uniref:Saccharopine dehydrogenase n=1 Tax=Aliikangiella coralliicola TaxID=2592383 RepID=A0A545U4L6_9GAMM|nr:saccharopine dehydrogenase C-terminal domain-containing protein [Aliikangiella coralliicola]TQV84402.1 saccharopine dehydrogenase [Aliikangiella coralliicola]